MTVRRPRRASRGFFAIAVADDARTLVARLFGRMARSRRHPRAGALVRRLFVDPDARVGTTALLAVVAAFVATGLWPLWCLALGPLVWGVPHVVADVRYLVVRNGFHRRAKIAAPAVIGIALAASQSFTASAFAGFAVAVALARGAVWRRVVVVAALLAVGGIALRAESAVVWAFAHLHNVVAVAFLVAWSRRARALAPFIVLYAGVVVAIALGALDGVIGRLQGCASLVCTPAHVGSLAWTDLVAALAPSDLTTALSAHPLAPDRLTLVYAFGQTIHYAVWLRLVPDGERARPRSFRQSVRALTADLRAPLLVVALALALVFVVWGLVDVAAARAKYLYFASFHAWLELAAGAVLFVEGRAALSAASSDQASLRR